MLCDNDALRILLSSEVYAIRILHLVSSMGAKTLDFLLGLFQVVFQGLDTCFE